MLVSNLLHTLRVHNVLNRLSVCIRRLLPVMDEIVSTVQEQRQWKEGDNGTLKTMARARKLMQDL